MLFRSRYEASGVNNVVARLVLRLDAREVKVQRQAPQFFRRHAAPRELVAQEVRRAEKRSDIVLVNPHCLVQVHCARDQQARGEGVLHATPPRAVIKLTRQAALANLARARHIELIVWADEFVIVDGLHGGDARVAQRVENRRREVVVDDVQVGEVRPEIADERRKFAFRFEGTNLLLRWGHHVYFTRLVPFLGSLLSDRQAYAYLPESVSYLPEETELLRIIEAAGFRQAAKRRLSGGIAQLVTAIRNDF